MRKNLIVFNGIGERSSWTADGSDRLFTFYGVKEVIKSIDNTIPHLKVNDGRYVYDVYDVTVIVKNNTHNPFYSIIISGVVNFVVNQGIRVVKNSCPVDGSTKREYAKQLMEQINRDNPGTKDRIMHAVVNGRFEDWPEVHRN
jgi:hypothetical protein